MARTRMNTTKGICYLCGAEGETEEHHCFGGPNRRLSEHYGLKVYLCIPCHRTGRDAVHNGGTANIRKLHEDAQRVFEQKWGTRDYFRQVFGRNYLED